MSLINNITSLLSPESGRHEQPAPQEFFSVEPLLRHRMSTVVIGLQGIIEGTASIKRTAAAAKYGQHARMFDSSYKEPLRVLTLPTEPVDTRGNNLAHMPEPTGVDPNEDSIDLYADQEIDQIKFTKTLDDAVSDIANSSTITDLNPETAGIDRIAAARLKVSQVAASKEQTSADIAKAAQ